MDEVGWLLFLVLMYVCFWDGFQNIFSLIYEDQFILPNITYLDKETKPLEIFLHIFLYIIFYVILVPINAQQSLLLIYPTRV